MSFTLWFMGRPASGKSTLAKRTEEALRSEGLPIENLDGDEIRKSLHPDLGFTREDRALNNRRTAFICKLLNRNGIGVVNAMITPFRDSQQEAREIISQTGEFVLIYVKCSVETAAKRDPKNLYQQAMDGNIENFTGVNHPFQPPHAPDIVIDTEEMDIGESVERILQQLAKRDIADNSVKKDYGFNLSTREKEDIEARLNELGYLPEDEL